MADLVSTDIAIGGGGIAGSVAALILGRLGFRVILIEPNLHGDRRRGGEMLHPRGVACLEQLGLLADVQAAGVTKVDGFHIRDAEAGDVILRYATAGLGLGIALDHARLHAVLFAAARNCPNVTVVEGMRVSGLDQSHGHVEIHVTGKGGDRRICADLLVGADGSRSRIRELAGIRSLGRRMPTISALTIPADALPDIRLGHVFVGGGRVSLAYPIGEGRGRLMVDHHDRPPHSAIEVAALLSPGCPADFRLRIQGLPVEQRVRQFPTDVVIVDKPYRGRVVLIGDAAGTCHPLTASGMTSGIVDAVTLAESLRDHPGNIKRAVRRYADQCRDRQANRLSLANAVHEVLASAKPEFRILRFGMMRYWRSVKGGKRAIALLSMAEDRPAKLRQAMIDTLRYSLGELMRPSNPARPKARWRIGLDISRIIVRYHLGSVAASGDSSRSTEGALP
ncbi:MAG: squalene monooxygenase [Aliidongia sp.]|jgi:2-polyprenyl-6-methoxyphenol hydroxylase-like FAD-dependent oxidoreductase|nr:squalene monooxygenase [Aliidongia sp.]